MNLKIVYKMGSRLCLILFYLFILLALFAVAEHYFFIWQPESSLTQSFGEFKPIFGLVNVDFFQQPELYTDKSFLLLSLACNTAALLFGLLFLWYMHKFLKNMYIDGLFMYENVSILYKLGLTILVVGTAYIYIDGVLLSKAITALEITNAQLSMSNFSFVDSIIGGILIIIIASALKTAVHAVEENKNTI